jgi:purine-binding chemotaxis protein CheW
MSESELQLACFNVGEETYGVDIIHIKEILLNRKITPAPKAPDFMEGIINLRGHVIPIVDMRKKFGLPAPEGGYKRAARIIIITIDKKNIGIIVDNVDNVITVNQTDVDPSPSVATGIGSEYLDGVAKNNDEMIMILNMKTVLTTMDRVKIAELQGLSEKAANKEEVN